MSRVVRLVPRGARRALGLACCASLLAGALGAPAAGQDLPPCDDERMSDCRLPDWSAADAGELDSLFGEVEGVVWVEDASGDVPPDGLDIVGVGLGTVEVGDAGAVRRADGLLKLGKAKQAVRPGANVLVRVVLDRAPDQVVGGHASVHVATDVDGSRSNNVPAGANRPDFPFAGSQDVYSLTWAETTGKTRLLSSDLGRKGWYQAKAPFAASWAAPNVLDFLVPPTAFGEGFRVVTHTAGEGGGYDSASLGPGQIPANGRLGLLPTCVEASIAPGPFVVSRLSEGGQTVRDVEAPASWRGGARLPIAEDVRTALEGMIGERDEDGDGRFGLPAWVNHFEEGVVIRQAHDLELALDGDHALVGLELGLTRRGYNVLRDFEPEPTGDARVDAWLERATDALRTTLPPFRTTRKTGLLLGEGTGACVPWLALPVEPVPDASASPPASEPTTTP